MNKMVISSACQAFLLVGILLLGSEEVQCYSRSTPSKRPPFLRRQDMCGIWKVSQQQLQLPSTTAKMPSETQEEIVLRLNDDGTFDPYTPEIEEDLSGVSLPRNHDLYHVLGRGGNWEYRDESLILAPDRPRGADGSQIHDTLLSGKLVVHMSECLSSSDDPSTMISSSEQESAELNSQEINANEPQKTNDADMDVHLTIPDGQVSIGKFMYPKKHKAFFDEPVLFKRSDIGSFSMNQLLGNLNARLKSKSEEPEAPPPKYHKKDFHNRTFYLTATPHPVNEQYAKQDVHYDESKALLDVRVMPVTFHSNNTFSAIGTEKILRGRYGLAGEHRDRLWLQVSLYGFGRSAPGSVYSEGRLLTHEDRRGYAGPVQEYEKHNRTVYFIEGLYYYGTDLRNARAPNSMGTFTLQEVDRFDEGIDDDVDEDSAGDDMEISSWDDSDDAFQ